MGLILLILVLLLIFGGAPQWGRHEYGYYPSGVGFLFLIVLLVLLLSGRL